MPFGQSFWVGRIVRSVVETATNDPELAKGVGKAAKWLTAAATHDWHTAVIDEVAETFVEDGAEAVVEEATETLFDEGTESVYSSSIESTSAFTEDVSHQSFRHITPGLRFKGYDLDTLFTDTILSKPEEMDGERLSRFLTKLSAQLETSESHSDLLTSINNAISSDDRSVMETVTNDAIAKLRHDRELAYPLYNLLRFAGSTHR